jgi:hypothetical protein
MVSIYGIYIFIYYIKPSSPNRDKLDQGLFGEFTKYITHNPHDKAKMDEQLKDFNEHMQRVIDDYETWTGVPEHLKCKLRDTNGKLKPISEWELQPKNTKKSK